MRVTKTLYIDVWEGSSVCHIEGRGLGESILIYVEGQRRLYVYQVIWGNHVASQLASELLASFGLELLAFWEPVLA